MWRLLAQKACVGQPPKPRRLFALSVVLEAAQGYFEIGRNNFKLQVAAHCCSCLIVWEILSRNVADCWHPLSGQNAVPALPQWLPALP
ncbi:hypothetical protein FQA47_017248 [Oryzias melastigma]|uniref:Uncharacterized protein n=1 Tax=Oryzias melastigma TaxID=30732 RepID=A0A834BVL1_ORYME|nr:hypothetical protein FQA47_017248 [Oryzias melastigma]